MHERNFYKFYDINVIAGNCKKEFYHLRFHLKCSVFILVMSTSF